MVVLAVLVHLEPRRIGNEACLVVSRLFQLRSIGKVGIVIIARSPS